MKKTRNTKAKRLAKAIKNYFFVYRNEGKEVGWFPRVEAAREEVFAIIEEIEAAEK